MISRTRFKSTNRYKSTVRQSEVGLGEPWEPSIPVENLNGEVTTFYLVRAGEEQVVYESMKGETITVLKEE